VDPNVGTQNDTAANAGLVDAQSPTAGTSVAAQSPVTLTLGAMQVSVPNVVGGSIQSAQTAFQAVGLAIGNTTTTTVANTVSPGFVLSESPAAGTPVASGSTVNLVVVAQTVTVPNVVNQSFGSAVITLQGAGLQMGTLTGNETTGNVSNQSPAYPAVVQVGTQVNLTVPSTIQCMPISRCIVFPPIVAKQFAIESIAKSKVKK
jgi:serine/threonine-protein kinase